MTASPLSPTGTRARIGARLRPRARLPVWITVVQALLLAAASSGGALADEPVKGEISVSTQGGYARLIFHFEKEVQATVENSFPVMVLKFKQPVAISVDRLSASAPDYISTARIDPDGGAIRIALVHKVKVDSIPAAERLYLDLLPETWTGILPGLPRDVIAELANRALAAERQLRQQQVSVKKKVTPTIRVRVGNQPTFTRYVFEMPDGTNVVPDSADGKLVLKFDQAIKWDLADAKADLPATVASVEGEVDDNAVAVTFTLSGTPKVHTFREDRSIVVDISRDGAAPKQAFGSRPAKEAASKPGDKPAIERPETVPAKGSASADLPVQPEPPAPVAHKKAAENSPAPHPAQDKEMAAAKAAAAQLAAAHAPAKSAAAAPKNPPPNPDAPVIVALHESGDTLTADFPFVMATPAAVFRRADMLWLVFDSPARINLAALSDDPSRTIRGATLTHGADGEAIVRIKLSRPRLASLQADGAGWIVTLGDTAAEPGRPLVIARNIVAENRASIAIPFDNPRRIHRIEDQAGDRLLVVTALAPARGILKQQNFVELRALPSTHGVILQPLADDVVAELAADKIVITRPGGLSLSPSAVGQQQFAASARALSFDTQVWNYDRKAKFTERQDDLIRIAALSPTTKRKQARVNLARFYLARDMAPEAKAVLDVAFAGQQGSEDVTGSVLKSVADLLLHRPDDALKELSNPLVGNQFDAPIWRAIAYARQEKWAEAHAGFKDADGAIAALPAELQRIALSSALRAAIEMHDFAGSDRLINEMETVGVPPAMAGSFAVLKGRLNEAEGRSGDALKDYAVAAASADRRDAAQGRLREILLRYATGDMAHNDVIGALETLTTIWRGDGIEAEGLKLLAHLYTQDKRYRDAFHVMRTALMAHLSPELTRQIQDEAAKTFDTLFLDGEGDKLPPIEALGLFFDFRDLTPIGRRGDEMIRRLADRLVSVDLLDQAAELLQHQVDHRLQGSARAQVATRLAVIYLMNRKPDRALVTLRATRTSDLSNDLRDQRLLLEARALSETGRHDLALELIANLNSREALRLRSDIFWAARRWREAAEQIETFYGERWRDFAPLNETERFDILRAAVGYALSDEAISLARLREKYSAKMADTPDRRAFDVVSAPIGSAAPEFQTVARRLAGINSLDAFLRDLRKRYPDSAPLSPNAAVKPEAAAKPAAPKSGPAKPQGSSSNAGSSDKAAANAPAKPAAPAPKPPVPPKADPTPTGSILPPRARTSSR